MHSVNGNDANTQSRSAKRHVVMLLLAIVAMVAVLLGSLYYPSPSGQALGVKNFVLLWFRELIILLFAAVVFIALGVGWLRRRIHRHRAEDNHAL